MKAKPRPEDVVSDVLIDEPQITYGLPATAGSNYRQLYLSGEAWIEVFFRIKVGGDIRNYVAVTSVGALDRLNAGREILGVDADDRERVLETPMLVEVSQLIEEPEGLRKELIPSLVRLYRIDGISDSLADRVRHEFCSAIDNTLGLSFHDGELDATLRNRCLFWREVVRDHDKRKQDVLKHRPQLVDKFAGGDTEVKERWVFGDQTYFAERLVSVELRSNAVWIERHELFHVMLDGFEVLFCPLQFRNRAFSRQRSIGKLAE